MGQVAPPWFASQITWLTVFFFAFRFSQWLFGSCRKSFIKHRIVKCLDMRNDNEYSWTEPLLGHIYFRSAVCHRDSQTSKPTQNNAHTHTHTARGSRTHTQNNDSEEWFDTAPFRWILWMKYWNARGAMSFEAFHAFTRSNVNEPEMN